MHPLEEFLINPSYLFLIVIFVVFLGIVFCVRQKRSDKFWRISNFIGLIFTCIGLFAICYDSRNFLYEREIYKQQSKINSVYSWSLIDRLNLDIYYREFVQTSHSPSSLDIVQSEWDTVHNWVKENRKYISDKYINCECVSPDSIHIPNISFTDKSLERELKELENSIISYNADIAQLEEYHHKEHRNDFEIYYLLLSPLCLSIGIGWEIVKFIAKR